MPNKKTKQQRRQRERRLIKSAALGGNVYATGEVEILAAEAESDDGHRFEMVAYAGSPMRPGGWNQEHPLILDVSGMEAPASGKMPVHRDHKLAQIVGHSDSIQATKSQVIVAGPLSADNEHSREILHLSGKGFPWKSSVGARLTAVPEFINEQQTVNVNGRRVTGPVFIGRKWRLFEASFASLGADENTSAIAAHHNKEHEMDKEYLAWLDDLGLTAEDSNPKLEALFEAQKAEPEETDVAATATTATAGNDGATADGTDLMASAADQMDRIAAIQLKCKDNPDIAASALRNNWDDERIDLALENAQLKKLQAHRESLSTGSAVHMKDGESGIKQQDIECAMFSSWLGQDSATERHFGEKQIDRTRQLQASGHLPRYCGLKYLIHEGIRANGGYVHPATMDDDTIRAAMTIDNDIRGKATTMGPDGIMASHGFSTVSVSGVLAPYAHKLLLEAFRGVPSTILRLCAIRNHTNFKVHQKWRNYGMQDLDKLGPGGEIKHTTMSEASYQNALDTYARMIALTRQQIIDDDLDAFSQIPMMFGDISARTFEKTGYTTFLDNTTSFFNASPTGYGPNLLTGAGSALDPTSLEDAKKLFMQQVDEDGNPTVMTPDFILTGEELSETAMNLVEKTTVQIADTNEAAGTPSSQLRVQDQFRGRFSTVATPWLDSFAGLTGSSDTHWFLIGGNGMYNPMEVAYLNGQRTPIIDMDDSSFNTLGRQFRVYWDWGFAQFEPRAAVKADGA